MCESVYVAGLGGQGVLTLAKILGDAAARQGHAVTVFNAKGMAQRGGRVTSEIRISSDTTAARDSRIPEGGADILIGLELGETLASRSYLKAGGAALLLNVAVVPASVVLTKGTYPSLSQVAEAYADVTDSVRTFARPEPPHNMYALGALGSILDENPALLGIIDSAVLEEAMTRALKRRNAVNLAAFRQGVEDGRKRAAAFTGTVS
jgi:indolepyruvate ferredoxin oxidoreductase beta subunit